MGLNPGHFVERDDMATTKVKSRVHTLGTYLALNDPISIKSYSAPLRGPSERDER